MDSGAGRPGVVRADQGAGLRWRDARWESRLTRTSAPRGPGAPCSARHVDLPPVGLRQPGPAPHRAGPRRLDDRRLGLRHRGRRVGLRRRRRRLVGIWMARSPPPHGVRLTHRLAPRRPPAAQDRAHRQRPARAPSSPSWRRSASSSARRPPSSSSSRRVLSVVGCVFRPAQMAWMPSLTPARRSSRQPTAHRAPSRASPSSSAPPSGRSSWRRRTSRRSSSSTPPRSCGPPSWCGASTRSPARLRRGRGRPRRRSPSGGPPRRDGQRLHAHRPGPRPRHGRDPRLRPDHRRRGDRRLRGDLRRRHPRTAGPRVGIIDSASASGPSSAASSRSAGPPGTGSRETSRWARSSGRCRCCSSSCTLPRDRVRLGHHARLRQPPRRRQLRDDRPTHHTGCRARPGLRGLRGVRHRDHGAGRRP